MRRRFHSPGHAAIKDLRAEGVSILYISHKFEEIFEVSDRISVLRDGEYIGTMDTKDAELDEVLSMMVGPVSYTHLLPAGSMREI